MDHFQYKNGILHGEGVSLAEIAVQVGTPFYAYSSATLTRIKAIAESAREAGLEF